MANNCNHDNNNYMAKDQKATNITVDSVMELICIMSLLLCMSNYVSAMRNDHISDRAPTLKHLCIQAICSNPDLEKKILINDLIDELNEIKTLELYGYPQDILEYGQNHTLTIGMVQKLKELDIHTVLYLRDKNSIGEFHPSNHKKIAEVLAACYPMLLKYFFRDAVSISHIATVPSGRAPHPIMKKYVKQWGCNLPFAALRSKNDFVYMNSVYSLHNIEDKALRLINERRLYQSLGSHLKTRKGEEDAILELLKNYAKNNIINRTNQSTDLIQAYCEFARVFTATLYRSTSDETLAYLLEGIE